jgi:multimeric flavodoxin WrbA
MVNDNVIVVLGSNRKNSNTKKFVTETYDLLPEQLIDLLDYQIAHYNYDEVYPEQDQFKAIIAKVLHYDMIVLATPVYWYAMSGLMKIFFDRFTDLMSSDKATGRKLKGKTVKLMVVGAEAQIPEGFEVPFKSTAEYFDMHYAGCEYRVMKD